MIVGLDLSLTATGVCVDGTCDTIKTKRTGMERLHELRSEILQCCDGADLVVIEGYAMGSARQSHSYATGELGGLIRYALWVHDIAYVEIPPASLKQFATGKGNANKDAMVATAARAGCPADDNNAVDAWWLFQMGAYQAWSAGRRAGPTPGLAVTAYRDKAVAAITWPTREVAA